MYFYKMLFSLTMIIGTFVSISSYSWMGMWIGLEINLLSIIPLMSESNNSLATEATLKYFITQVLASTLILFSIIMLSLNFMYNSLLIDPFTLMMNTALLMKMGAAPFHFWFPEVIEGLNWTNSFIMMTWQKIAPMVLLSYTNINITYVSICVVISMIVSGISGLNQISMRKILAYSSINHIGWMLTAMMFTENIWSYYFIIYSMMSFNIIYILNKFNIYYLKQLFISLNTQPIPKLFFNLNFLSLGGLPPFIGFLPKWLTIQMLINNEYYLLALLMMMLTLMTLYFYMRVTFSTVILKMSEPSFFKNNINKTNIIMTINFIVLISLIFCTLSFNFQ
uniref:NADH-ubiquinone oxidoreductase chain 2 n=1 Tax=Aphodius foetens TaxID=207149 RepID=A0A343C235_9SCAR|nr:NADH dehydrogenase subunit 2 [Aphodius foetens]QNV12162.1 NADH dehydrogenase subunit 2 [Aphodius foetens]